MLTFAKRRQNLKRLSADVRADRQVTAVACDVMGIGFGPAEVLNHADAEEYVRTTENIDGCLQEVIVPAAWVKTTNNRKALLFVGA